MNPPPDPEEPPSVEPVAFVPPEGDSAAPPEFAYEASYAGEDFVPPDAGDAGLIESEYGTAAGEPFAPPAPDYFPTLESGEYPPPGDDSAGFSEPEYSTLPESGGSAPEAETFTPPESEYFAPAEAEPYSPPEPGYLTSPETQVYAPLESQYFSSAEAELYPPPEPGYLASPETEAYAPLESQYFAPAEAEPAALPGFAHAPLPETTYTVAYEAGDAVPPEPATDHFAPPEAVDAPPPAPARQLPPGVPDAEVALLCEGLERFLGSNEARVHVLRGVSLRLEPGFVHAVVGPSGCGKSSLLYILGLLDRPDAGRLVISGQPVADLHDDELSRQRNALLGFIFQFHFLLQDFTAQENIMIPMRQLGVLGEAAMRDRASYLLDAVGLGEKGHRPSRHLSGGEQQRVAIARALANDPQVILADEPTGNLDTANSTRVFSLLTDLVHRENKALLLVTHNPGIADACDWVHTMRDGLIVEQQFVGGKR